MTHDEMRRRLDDLTARVQQLEGSRLAPTQYARPTDRFPTLHADRERPGTALGIVRVSEQSRHLGLSMNARLEGDDAEDGA